MSKITFRADDELVDRLDGLEASKSEIMRDALRSYLSEAYPQEAYQEIQKVADRSQSDPIDELIRDRVDTLFSERLDRESRTHDNLTVTITVDGAETGRNTAVTQSSTGQPAVDEGSDQCTQCGESIDDEHVYCPNCGEKASRRSFCECGDELRSDWAFCPSCGRRTPAADVLDSN